LSKQAEKASPGHLSEGCEGKFVTEYNDAEGDHTHCPKCGAWVVSPGKRANR
jgi:hypothetical protein